MSLCLDYFITFKFRNIYVFTCFKLIYGYIHYKKIIIFIGFINEGYNNLS